MSAPARPTRTTTLRPATHATTFTHSIDGSPTPSARRHAALSAGFAAAALAVLFLNPAPAQAQDLVRPVVEYSCPLTSNQTVPPADPFPGALVAENGYVYYVTRAGELRLVRLTPSLTPTCNWWDLDALTVTTGGLRIKNASSHAFIRGVTDLQRINTVTNVRTRWVDGLTSVSDVAILYNGAAHVFTTGAEGCGATDPVFCDPLGGVVQRFSVWNGNNTGTITRWFVGGGAGLVPYSGIDVHPTSTNLVYFSQPFDNMVGELNTNSGAIRRWNLGLAATLTTTPVFNPRQLDVDSGGLVWVVTGSGHLVRIDPLDTNGNNVVVADIPFLDANNPAALNADGTIGFTAQDLHKVGVLSPQLTTFSTVPPVAGADAPESFPLSSTSSATVTQFTGPALRFAKSAPATELPDLNMNGLFTEAFLDLATPVDNCLQVIDPLLYPDHPCLIPSTLPQGIAHDPARAGAFYAAIGGSVLRVAHVGLLTGSAGGGVTSGSGKVALTDPVTGLSAGTGSFSLWAYKTSPSQAAKGALNYTAPDGKVDSLQITGLTFSGTTATITGLCKTGSSCTTFQLKVTDGGWQASQDSFKIIKDPVLGLGLEKGGNLGTGGIKMYRW